MAATDVVTVTSQSSSGTGGYNHKILMLYYFDYNVDARTYTIYCREQFYHQVTDDNWANGSPYNYLSIDGTIKCTTTNNLGSPSGKGTFDLCPTFKGSNWQNMGTYAYNANGTPVQASHDIGVSCGYSSSWAGIQRKVTHHSISAPTIEAIGNPTISTSNHSSSQASRGSANGSHSWTISATAGAHASISRYSSSCNGGSSTSTTPSFGSLYNNTVYSWSSTVTNSAGYTATTSGSFYINPVSPASPTIGAPTNFVRSGNTYTASASMSSSYDRNRTWGSWGVSGVTVSSSTSSSINLSNLSPNTTYTITATTTDKNNGGGYSSALTSGSSSRTFTTPCKAPTNINITLTSPGTTSLGGQVSADGDINAPITSYILYYQTSDRFNQLYDQGYTIASMINDGLLLNASISGTNWSATNLSVDTDYVFLLRASNAGGTATSGISQDASVFHYSTNLDSPIITSFVNTGITPITCGVSVNAYSASGRTLNYQFSKDNGSTWTSYSTESTYLWTGLMPETQYVMMVRVKAIASGSGSDTYVTGSLIITTPVDQAKTKVKVNGEWVKGKTYIKINGSWEPAKKIYRKINGVWICGYNYDVVKQNISNNMTTWNANYPERGNVQYDAATGVNTITVTGESGWEHYYIPINCIVGKRYKIELDWQTPSGYVPYTASGLTGIYAVIYDGMPGTSGYDTIAAQTDTTKRVSLPVNYNGSTYSMTFRATTPIEYLSINFGGLQDGILYAASVRIKNIKLTYYEY